MAFTLIVASYQAMLFTFSILTLINVDYITQSVVFKVSYIFFYVMAGLYWNECFAHTYDIPQGKKTPFYTKKEDK